MSNTQLKTVLSGFILLWLCHVAFTVQVSNKVINGRVTTIARAQYMAQLWDANGFFCGGSLISTTHVLTAAHCVKGKQRSAIRVHLGTSTLSQNGTVRSVARAFIPKIFNTRTSRMDVAVLKLSQAVSGTNIQTIGLCNSRMRTGLRLQLYGWGTLSENSDQSSNNLRTVTVPVFNRAICKRRYRNSIKLTRTMFCAGIPGGADSCFGDSGGPAVFNNRVCGIVSFGAGCGRPGITSVYTSVPMVRRFINRALAR